ncbi:MAG: MBL fold metallo-hydrolase, partial [Natronomonas sp.]
ASIWAWIHPPNARMKLTILGTGAAIPTGDRYQSGLLYESAETTLLVDCGSGILHRLVQAGCDPTEIDAILLTHTHLDHVADLPGIAKVRAMEGVAELRIIAPSDTREVLDPWLSIDDIDERIALVIDEIDPGPHGIDDVEFRATRTTHSKPCHAYRFGDRWGFTGDAEAAPELLEFFDGVDVLVADCAYSDDRPPENHPTPTALAQAFEEANTSINRLYLTHLYPDAAKRASETIETVSAATDASVRVASDLDEINLE